MKLFLVAVLLVLINFTSRAAEGLVMHATPVNPKHSDLHEIIVQAYANLDVPVRYTYLPFARGLVSANYGVIDAIDLRLDTHVSEYPGLIKVDFPVYTSNLLLVVNQNNCVDCLLTEVEFLATVNGYDAAQYFTQERLATMKIQEFPEHPSLLRFFERGRTQGMIIGDIFLPETYLHSSQFKVYKLGTYQVYHYLNKKHHGIAKRLERAFRRIYPQIARNPNNQPFPVIDENGDPMTTSTTTGVMTVSPAN